MYNTLNFLLKYIIFRKTQTICKGKMIKGKRDGGKEFKKMKLVKRLKLDEIPKVKEQERSTKMNSCIWI